MKFGLHLESQFLISSHHRDRNAVTCGDEKGCIQHIFWFSHFFPAYLQENVSAFDSSTGGRRVLEDLRYLRPGTIHWLRRLGNVVHSDPAMSCLAETDEIAADFLCRLDWDSKAG